MRTVRGAHVVQTHFWLVNPLFREKAAPGLACGPGGLPLHQPVKLLVKAQLAHFPPGDAGAPDRRHDAQADRLGLGLLAVMVYIIRARLTVDRIIGINLTGTLVAIIIAILAYLLGEDYLADVAIVYVVLSFIAVMLLCRIYINLYQHKRQDKKEDESHDR